MSSDLHPNFHYDVKANAQVADEERVSVAKLLRSAEPSVLNSLAAADIVLAWMLSEGYHRSEASSPEISQSRRALQNVLGKLIDLQQQWNSREYKYVPVRTANGRTQVWIQRLKQWVPVLEGDGEATTKDIHDAIRQWELEGR